MDVTNGLADKLPGIIKPALDALTADLLGAEHTVTDVESDAVLKFHATVIDGVQALVAGEQAVVTHLFSELDQRIGKFAAVAKATADALSAAFPVAP